MNNKMAITIYLAIISLNELNASTKSHRVAEWVRKQDRYTCCPRETQFRSKDTQTERKEMKKDIS